MQDSGGLSETKTLVPELPPALGCSAETFTDNLLVDSCKDPVQKCKTRLPHVIGLRYCPGPRSIKPASGSQRKSEGLKQSQKNGQTSSERERAKRRFAHLFLCVRRLQFSVGCECGFPREANLKKIALSRLWLSRQPPSHFFHLRTFFTGTQSYSTPQHHIERASGY